MSKNEKPINNNPYCCGERTIWMDMGKWVQYFYCKKCKKEYKEPEPFKWKNGSYGVDFANSIVTDPIKDNTMSAPLNINGPPIWTGSPGGAGSGNPPSAPANFPPIFRRSASACGHSCLIGRAPCTIGTHYWHHISDYFCGLPCNCDGWTK